MTSADWDNFISLKGTERFFDTEDIDLVPAVSNKWLTPEEVRQ
jgi:hypothetical protein